jgi:hypothetical protein
MQIKKIELFDLSRPKNASRLADIAGGTACASAQPCAVAAFAAVPAAAKKTLIDIDKYYGIMFANEKEPSEFDKLFAGIGFRIRC